MTMRRYSRHRWFVSAVQARDSLGTFWAHLVSKEVNSGESHFMSFRRSASARLMGQHPKTGSIPGSSTSKAKVRDVIPGLGLSPSTPRQQSGSP